MKRLSESQRDADDAPYGTEIAYCPVCGPEETSQYVVSNGYHIVTCCRCRILFVNPRPDSRETALHFAKDYITTIERVERDFISFRGAALRREANRIRKICEHGGRLLDIGSASGAFLFYFKGDPRWMIEGVEPSRVAAHYSREKLGLNVHEGYLADMQFRDGTFDVVTSLDTFMFHADPNGDLKEIARILKPGGIFAVDIPGLNFRLLKNTGPICQLLYGESARLNAGVHLYFYSRQTLSRLVEKHGFRLIAWYPEQGPVYGSLLMRGLNYAYFAVAALLYRCSVGWINLVPKEFLIFRKGA